MGIVEPRAKKPLILTHPHHMTDLSVHIDSPHVILIPSFRLQRLLWGLSFPLQTSAFFVTTSPRATLGIIPHQIQKRKKAA